MRQFRAAKACFEPESPIAAMQLFFTDGVLKTFAVDAKLINRLLNRPFILEIPDVADQHPLCGHFCQWVNG